MVIHTIAGRELGGKSFDILETLPIDDDDENIRAGPER
jgi:hypothetical protein